MDLEYIKILKKGGCGMLSFGIESGSQRVLDLMKKNVKRDAVEQNLKDLQQQASSVIPIGLWGSLVKAIMM
jgi:radical SAM superfamily enzyme YgiQ (UPF0313 family)